MMSIVCSKACYILQVNDVYHWLNPKVHTINPFSVTILFLYFIYCFNKILDFGSYVKEAMLCCSNPFHVILQSFLMANN